MRRYTDQDKNEYIEGVKAVRETFDIDSPVVKKLGRLEGKL